MNITLYGGDKVKSKNQKNELIYMGRSSHYEESGNFYDTKLNRVFTFPKESVREILVNEKMKFTAFDNNKKQISWVSTPSYFAKNKRIDVLAKSMDRLLRDCQNKRKKASSIRGELLNPKWHQVTNEDSVELMKF